MRRVVVTGIGIVSSIGNNQAEVLDSLKEGRSGIVHCPKYAELGFRSHVHGTIKMDVEEVLNRKQRRFMGEGAAYNFIAMEEAVEDSGLEPEDVSNERTGIIMGSGGPSMGSMVTAIDTLREKSAKRVGPFVVPKVMSSTHLKFTALITPSAPPARPARIASAMAQN
jgi:3-oxoacyl-[acyl-carrier-protein] synthase-1